MTARVPRAALANLGCRVNRVELDAIATKLEAAGFLLCGESDADYIVINTCAVTGEAEAKTRKAIRHAASRPQAPLVVATGCVASLFADELSALAPNVHVVANKREVADYVIRLAESSESLAEAGSPGADGIPSACDASSARDGSAACGSSSDARHPVTPTGRTRPGVQVQDGCDNRCTYCIIWKARGRARSFDPAGIEEEVRAAMARGAHEVVLTGINLGDYRWGSAEDPLRLPGLLSRLLERTGVERLRLSSIEPPDVTDDLARLMAASNGRVAPFLHICLQSGCDETLRRMARVYRTPLFRENVQRARSLMPDLALGTDLIVGFPGETDAQFEESLAFCEEMRFAKMHIFRYSRRPGTPAAEFPDQVSPQVMAERSLRAHELAARLRLEEASRLVGKRDLVVVQYPGRAVSGGLFDVAVDPAVPLDTLLPVRFTDVREDGTLIGEKSA